jgi:sugar phosphate isomerase/epimerase
VEVLGPLVDDVELVLFESEEHGGNMPDVEQISRLGELAAQHDLTYTVHLPLDLRLGDEGGEDQSLRQARRVIEITADLAPAAYTLHLDGRPLLNVPGFETLRRWQDNSYRALELLSREVDDPGKLCIENVEGWDPEAFAPVVETLPVGRAIDVGHLWLRGIDPSEHLTRWIDRTRIIHLHGIAERDHASLALIEPDRLDPVTALLLERFSGIVTLEVFNMEDLTSSIEALRQSIERVTGRGQ